MLNNMAHHVLSRLALRLNRYAAAINNYLAQQDASTQQPEPVVSQDQAPAHWLEKVRQGAPHLLQNDSLPPQPDSDLQPPEQHNETARPTTSSQQNNRQTPANNDLHTVHPVQQAVTSSSLQPQTRQKAPHPKSDLDKQTHAVSANSNNTAIIQTETNKVRKHIQDESLTNKVNTEISPPIHKDIKKTAIDFQKNTNRIPSLKGMVSVIFKEFIYQRNNNKKTTERLNKYSQSSVKKHINKAAPKTERFNKHSTAVLKAQPKSAYAPKTTHKKPHSEARHFHLTARPLIEQKKNTTKAVQQQKLVSRTAQQSPQSRFSAAAPDHNHAPQEHKASITGAEHHKTATLNNRQQTSITPDETIPVSNTEPDTSIANKNFTQQQANPKPSATQNKQTHVHNTIDWPALFDQVTPPEQQDKWPQLPESTYFKVHPQKQHFEINSQQQAARQRKQEQRGTLWNA